MTSAEREEMFSGVTFKMVVSGRLKCFRGLECFRWIWAEGLATPRHTSHKFQSDMSHIETFICFLDLPYNHFWAQESGWERPLQLSF